MSIAVQGGAITVTDFVGEGGGPSPNIMATREAREAVRVVRCDWSDIDALLLEMFPAPPALPGQYPGVSYLYVDDAEIVPWPDIPSQSDISCVGNIPVYDLAKVTIKYAPLKYDASDLITRQSTYRVEAMLLPANALKWEGGADVQQEDLQAGKMIPFTEHVFTYHRVPPAKEAAIDAAIRDNQGMVNAATFEGAAAETLLFSGAEKTWTIDSSGNQTFTFTYHFMEKVTKQGEYSVGWNHFYRNSDSKWLRLIDKNTNMSMYSSSLNFDDLFA